MRSEAILHMPLKDVRKVALLVTESEAQATEIVDQVADAQFTMRQRASGA